MKRLYESSARRAPAPMRTIHRERKSRFFSLRPTYPYLSDFSTASCAERYSLLLVRKKPFARASVFLRLLRRLVPRLTLGTFKSPYIGCCQCVGGSGTCMRTVHT